MRSSPRNLYCALAAALAATALHSAHAAPVTVTFQNGVGDYYGTVDRQIGYQAKDGFSSTGGLSIDGGDAGLDDSNACSVLMRFEDIENMIPAGAKIIRAQITVTQTTSGSAHSGNAFSVYRLTRAFDSDSNIGANADFGADGLKGDVDMLVGSFDPPNIATTASLVNADVTRAVQSWVDGSPNLGVGIRSDRDRDGWGFNSTGATNINNRPKLTVTYILGDDPQVHTFRQGLNGYDGCVDIYPNNVGASVPTSAATSGTTRFGGDFEQLFLDGVNPPTTEPDNPALIRFDNVEAAVNGRRIESAVLRLVTGFNSSAADSVGPFTVHRLLVPFSKTTKYSDLAGGSGAMLAAGQIGPAMSTFAGMQDCEVAQVDISEAVKAWAAGEPNYGLYIGSGTADGWQIFTSGVQTVATPGSPFAAVTMEGSTFRPEIRIVSTPPLAVELTAPDLDSRHVVGTPFTFAATTRPKAPATVSKVEFLVDGVVIGTDTSAPYTFSYPADKLGNYTLTARLTDSANVVTNSDPVSFSVVPPTGTGGLYFDGISDHVALGDPAALKLSTFTVETWFKREARGTTTTTGTGGITAIPLVAKGRNQGENSTLDTNWFLGIRDSDGTLMGDFEASTGGTNVPITGQTAIPYGQWNHAAMTYGNGVFRLYLNGNLEREIKTTLIPRMDSIQHASIATAMNSEGLGEGAFGGYMDEVRIWNLARTPEQIRQSLNAEVISGTGLVTRWGMTEGTGSTITSSVTPALVGNFNGTPIWTSGAVFNNNALPTVAFTGPADSTTYNIGQTADIQVSATDPDGSVAKVEYYDNGALVHTATSAPFSFPYSVLGGNRRITVVITDNQGGVTKADLGLLLKGTIPAPTLQGLTAGIIDGGDEEIFLGGTPKNPAEWAVVSSTNAPLAFTNPGTTLGDIAVQINGSNVPSNSGVLLTTNVVLDGNTASLDNITPPYSTGGNYRVASWDNNGPGELEPVTTPESSSFAMGFFPYNKGWLGTTVNGDATVMEGAGPLPPGVTVTNTAVGAYRIAGLPVDGNVIAVAAGKNSDDVATVSRNGEDYWQVLIRDNNQNAENAPFTFLFIPASTGSVLSGQIANAGEVGGLNREAAMVGVQTRQTVQGYELTFGDGSVINPSNTALFISGDGAVGNGADNIYSYFANGNSFTVFSHDLPGLNGVFQAGGFRFLAVPLNPRVAGSDEVAVSVTKAFATEGVVGDTQLIFTVGRSGSTAAALNVNYTLGGTATAGNDYTNPSGTVTIPAGAASATITIDVINDLVLETDETVVVTLAAGSGYSLSPYVSSMGTIRNAPSNLESTTVTFQQGADGYAGAFQRRIVRAAGGDSAANGDTNPNSLGVPTAQQSYSMDGGVPDANDSIRFDDIIGSAAGQIPAGAKILKAELSMLTMVQADAQSGGPYAVGRLLSPMTRETTYGSVHGGAGDFLSGIRGIVDMDNVASGFGQVAQGQWNTADVTSLVREWVENGKPNHGFAMFSAGTTDAWIYATIGNNTIASRPKLVVTFTTVPTEKYELAASSSALFDSRTGSTTIDGATITDEGYVKTAPNDIQEAMIKFPLLFQNGTAGAIPLDREIVKAELVIRTGGNNDSWTSGAAAIHQVIAPWTTSTTFGLNGAQIGVHVAASSTEARGMGKWSYSVVDVTSIVRNWRAGAANEGFSLKLGNAQNWGFHFPGDAVAGNAPVLRIITNTDGTTPVETPFEEWARLSGAAGIGMNDDSDGDGIVALAEYALGFSPTAHNVLPGVTRNGENLSLSFPKGTQAAGDAKLTYQIASSINLVDWTVETGATQTASAISLNVTEGAAKKFYRLQVVRTP